MPNFILKWRLLELAWKEDQRRKENRQRKVRRARALQRRNDIDPLVDLSDAEFMDKFRLSKSTFRDLMDILAPFIPIERRSDGIPVQTKILIALAFYASGSYQSSVGQSTFHNVSQSTVSRAVKQVTEALNQPEVYKKIIKWPLHPAERSAIESKFYNNFKIPGVLGCINGTHVAILKQDINDETYLNSKGYHSLNVMIICDADLNITCIDASNPGSKHNSTVWQNHPISSSMFDGESGYLLGSSEYPLQKCMMTPILNTVEGTPQHHYSKIHVSTHNCVERCIRILKARFRCLLVARKLHYNPAMAAKIVNACGVLHNIANATNADIPCLSPEEEETENFLQQQTAAESNRSFDGDVANNCSENRDLLAGCSLQQALIERLWRDKDSCK